MMEHKFVYSAQDEKTSDYEQRLTALDSDGWGAVSFTITSSGKIVTLMTRHVSAPRDLGGRR